MDGSMSLTIEALNREVKFKTSRSSGAGGQNVNKVETKVTLYWAMEDSVLLTEEQKEKLAIKLSSRTNAEGHIQIEVSETRSQLQNKEIALQKLFHLITDYLKPTTQRKATRIVKAEVHDLLDRKVRQSKVNPHRRWRMVYFLHFHF